MGILGYEEFSRGKRTPLKHSQSDVQEATYDIQDFAFLKNTRHIDPEELIPYKIIDIFVRKGLLVASRKPLFSQSKKPTRLRYYTRSRCARIRKAQRSINQEPFIKRAAT